MALLNDKELISIISSALSLSQEEVDEIIGLAEVIVKYYCNEILVSGKKVWQIG